MADAQRLPSEGDYPRASEKLPEAVVEIINAVAAKRGVELGTHRSIGEYVSKLSKEQPSSNLIQGFSVASALHTNFYENHMPANHVKANAEFVEEFDKKLTSRL